MSLIRNRDVVSTIQRASDAETLIQQLKQIAARYWPSDGPLGMILRNIGVPLQRALVFIEITEPNNLPPFQLNADMISAKAFAAIYRTLHNDIGALQKATEIKTAFESTVREVNLIKSSYQAELARFKALVEKCDTDWKDKIEGFVQKQALEAPKAYWQERASAFSTSAKGDRRIWLAAIVVVSIGIAAFLVYILDHATAANNITVEFIVSAQRIVIFGTLLGFAVWWLRQKLRDLRTNDHLANDAAERVTMIQTFAAMRASGLQDANLDPILAALYRPAAGVTIDDGGPVLPLEMLLKSMGNALKK
jgi:hypothetical protein